MSDAPETLYLSPNPDFENKWRNPIVVDPFEDEDIFEYRLTPTKEATNAQIKAHPKVMALVGLLHAATTTKVLDDFEWLMDARAALAELEDKTDE